MFKEEEFKAENSIHEFTYLNDEYTSVLSEVDLRRYYWLVGVVALCAVSLQVGIWGLNFMALFCKSGIALLTGKCYNLCKTVSILCHKPQISIT